MSYTLRVLFSGLCAFVPERPFSTGDPGAVTVLLPNALNPIQLKNKVKEGDGVDILNSHFPLVSFDLADLHPQSSRKPDLRREDSGRGACLLMGEELSFAMRSNGSQNNGLTSEASLASMARLDDATPGLFVKSELLGPEFKSHKLVIARTHLTRGVLRVSKKSKNDCVFFPLVEGQDSVPTKIATELALEVDGIEGNVSILTQGSTSGERSITLSPVRRPDLLEIQIQNIELDDFLGIPGGLRNGDEVSDFEIFYRLVNGEVDPRFPRQPDPEDKDDGNFKNPSLCPPTELARAAA